MSAGYISLVYSPLTLFRVRVKQIWCSHIGYRVLTFLIHISLTNAIYVCTQDRCVSCNKDLSKLKLPRLKYQWMVASKWMLLCNVTAWVRQHTNYWAAKQNLRSSILCVEIAIGQTQIERAMMRKPGPLIKMRWRSWLLTDITMRRWWS